MIKIRNYQESDNEAYRDLYCQVDWEDEFGLRLCELKLNKPRYVPQRDLFLAEVRSGNLVGFADITNETKIGRIIVEGFIRSEFRRKGIGSLMLAKVRERAKALGADRIHVYVDDYAVWSRAFLEHVRLNPVREHLEFERDLDEKEIEITEHEDFEMKFFSEGEEQALADIQNQVFEGSWGFCPNSIEDIRYYLALTNCRINDVLHFHLQGESAGYLWPRFSQARAGIHMIGLLPKFRGKHLSKPLLSVGLGHLISLRKKLVDLTVDAQNAPAISLYKSLGFIQKSKKIWYELVI